jgi:hypothetical protein
MMAGYNKAETCNVVKQGCNYEDDITLEGE